MKYNCQNLGNLMRLVAGLTLLHRGDLKFKYS
jgi:hypothetical protein